MDEYGVDLLEDLRIRSTANSGRGPTGDSAGSRPFKFKKKDVPTLAEYMQSDGCRKVYLMVFIIPNLVWGLVGHDLGTEAWCRCGVRSASDDSLVMA
jgi:hypothetical protein